MDAAIRYVACEPIHIQKVRRIPEDPDEFRNTTAEWGTSVSETAAGLILGNVKSQFRDAMTGRLAHPASRVRLVALTNTATGNAATDTATKTPLPRPLSPGRGEGSLCVLVLAEGLQAFGFDFGRVLVIWTFLQVLIHGFDEQLAVGLHFFNDL